MSLLLTEININRKNIHIVKGDVEVTLGFRLAQFKIARIDHLTFKKRK